MTHHNHHPTYPSVSPASGWHQSPAIARGIYKVSYYGKAVDGKLCTKHQQRLNSTGSVNQRSLRYKVFSREIEEVRQLFTDMPNHPALRLP